jgi:XTP/dITP diphosphohydrolase
MTKIIYATTNPGKFNEVKSIFAHHKVNIYSPMDFGKSIEVEETGSTLQENALLKVKAYIDIFPNDIIIADDTGVEIDGLGGEPGIKVRRWKGYRMEDEEIIEHCLARMSGIKEGSRGAQFHTVLAVAEPGKEIVYFDGIFKGQILAEPKPEREVGMPFWAIFFIPELNMTLGELHHMPMDFQLKYPTHREKAVIAALRVSPLKSYCL